MTTFAKNLRAILEERGITQTRLAREAGINYTSIQNWISGRFLPNLYFVYIIADYLKVSPAELVGECKE